MPVLPIHLLDSIGVFCRCVSCTFNYKHTSQCCAHLVQWNDGDTIAQLTIAEKRLGSGIRIHHNLQARYTNCCTPAHVKAAQQHVHLALKLYDPSIIRAGQQKVCLLECSGMQSSPCHVAFGFHTKSCCQYVCAILYESLAVQTSRKYSEWFQPRFGNAPLPTKAKQNTGAGGCIQECG